MGGGFTADAGAALAKELFMAAFGVAVLIEASIKVFVPITPNVETMGIVGGLALAANTGCFVLLYRHRGDNLNMSSTWLCSRNDLIANLGDLLAAGAAALFVSRWPDIVVGVAIALLFLRSAFGVILQATRAQRAPAKAIETPLPRPISMRAR